MAFEPCPTKLARDLVARDVIRGFPVGVAHVKAVDWVRDDLLSVECIVNVNLHPDDVVSVPNRDRLSELEVEF